MKNYWSLNVSRAVSQVIMRVHKPKVEYKLALQEKPQGSILTYYYKTNNLTRINRLNTRLIIASNKIRHEIPFKTKRVKYTAIWKKSIKIGKESKLSFFTTFPSSIVFIPSSTILLFSLLILEFPPPHLYCFPSSSTSSTSYNNRNEEKVSLKLASKNLVRSKLKPHMEKDFHMDCCKRKI